MRLGHRLAALEKRLISPTVRKIDLLVGPIMGRAESDALPGWSGSDVTHIELVGVRPDGEYL